MRDQIKFERVATVAQWETLKEIAKEDGHRFDDHSIDPVVMIKRGEKIVGWYHVITQPVLMPSFSTDRCSKRDFVESCTQLRAIHQFNSTSERFPSGTCFIGLPPNPVIDEEIIGKLGFEDCKRSLWQATPSNKEAI